MKTIKPVGKSSLVSIDEAIRRVEACSPKIIRLPSEPIIPYLGVDWQIKKLKTLVNYEEGLKYIQGLDFERFPSPQEFYSLIVHGWQNCIKERDPSLNFNNQVYDDIHDPHIGDFFSHFMLRYSNRDGDNILEIYEFVKNISIGGPDYEVDGTWYTDALDFKIGNLKGGCTFKQVHEQAPELFDYLVPVPVDLDADYAKEYEIIYLPEDEEFQPMMHGTPHRNDDGAIVGFGRGVNTK